MSRELEEFVMGKRESVVLENSQAKAITPLGLIIEPGTEVEIGWDPEHPEKAGAIGVILQVSIRPNFCVYYEVQWWNGKEMKEGWFPTFAVRPKELGNGYRTIGFK